MSGEQKHSYRGWLLAAVLYTLLTLLVTYPVVTSLSKAVAGFEAKDSLQYTWSLWWSGEAWARGQSAADVSLLYHPWGGDHALLEVTPLLDVVVWPLQRLLTPTACYNLLLLASFPLCGLAMFALARDLTHRWAPAFLAGLIWAFYPNRMGHALVGHLTQLSGWLFPLVGLVMVRLFRDPSRRRAVVFGLLLGLSGQIALVQTGYFLAPFCAIMLIGLAIRHRAELRVRARYVGAGLLIAALIMLPTYGPFVLDAVRAGTDLDVGGATENAVDLLSLVTPSPYHPLWGGALQRLPALLRIFSEADELERCGYLGIGALLLAVWGLVRRRDWLWGAMALVGLVLCLGPELQVAGRLTGIPLPYALWARLPLMGWGRTPERFCQLAMFAMALLAAQGLASFQLSRVAMGALLVLVVVDLLVLWPFPVGTDSPPTFLQDWQGESRAVLNMPIKKRQIGNLAMYYQTEHGLPIVGGYIHRDLEGMRDYTKAINAVVSDRGEDAWRAMTPVELQGLLRGLDIGHVLVHRQFVKSEDVEAQVNRLLPVLGPPTAGDERVLAFDVPPALVPQPAQGVYGEALALIGARNEPFIVAGETLTVTLDWECLAPAERDLTVFVHLVDAQGERWAQHDGPPVGGNWPTSLWSSEERVIDQHGLALPDDMPSGQYDLLIGWYDPASKDRVPLVGGSDAMSDSALLLSDRVQVRGQSDG